MPEPAATPHQARLSRLRAHLKANDAQAALITDPTDVGYLTGFLGGDSVLLVTAKGKPTLVSDRRYEEDLAPLKPRLTLLMRAGAMAPFLGRLLADTGLTRVLIQPEHMTVQTQAQIAKAAGKRSLVPEPGLIAGLRLIKDDAELALMRKAVKIQEQALLATLPTLQPGQTELAVTARLEFEMKSRGANASAFSTIVAARANGSRPHHSPGTTKTARNTALLIDWGAVWAGYRGDMTRVFALGRWPKPLAEVYQIVLDAHELAAAAIKPGVTNHQLDRIARDHIAHHGYGQAFAHSLGHGIGLNTHEAPGLSQQAAEVTLQPGMVITIEPGVYIPGLGGVRIEDDYAVTTKGRTNLCSLPKDLAFATLA
jgi:Xaa-Pro aminopeptidase